MGVVALSEIQQIALARYGRAFRGAKSETNAMTRLSSGDTLKHARAAITPTEAAALDFIAGKGLSLDELATKANAPAEHIAGLLRSAAAKLADHFESTTE
jgi:hypothetical protein